MKFKAVYRYEVIGFASTYQEAKNLLIQRFGKFDGQFMFIEIME